MRIRADQKPRELRPNAGGPATRIAEKEPLLGRETVDIRWSRFALHRMLESCISDHQTTEVGDRFTLDQAAVFVQALLNFKAIELVDDALRFLLKRFQVSVAPPVCQVPGCIELTTLIVKAVRHFMPNHRTHAAVIQSVVGAGVEERRLQNAGGKNDLIATRYV